ncbi:hypothetical protein BDQ12DRAFT_762139, partial [Crucibulum laeve]
MSDTKQCRTKRDLKFVRCESLIKWQIPNILRGLPILLQLALVLFFLGMQDLLRSLDPIITIVLSVIVGLVLFITVATTIIPGLQLRLLFLRHSSSWSNCPYKSPQSW